MVSLVDPDSADAATALGVGGRGDFLVGGRIDARAPGPVALHAEVVALDEAANTGRSAALRVLDGDRQIGRASWREGGESRVRSGRLEQTEGIQRSPGVVG